MHQSTILVDTFTQKSNFFKMKSDSKLSKMTDNASHLTPTLNISAMLYSKLLTLQSSSVIFINFISLLGILVVVIFFSLNVSKYYQRVA